MERIDASGSRYVFHADALGSVWVVTDATDSIAERYRYEAFGKLTILAPDYSLLTSSSINNRYTYTARESIGDSLGLFCYRWRVMDPNAGRFTSEDPLLFHGGNNLYL